MILACLGEKKVLLAYLGEKKASDLAVCPNRPVDGIGWFPIGQDTRCPPSRGTCLSGPPSQEGCPRETQEGFARKEKRPGFLGNQITSFSWQRAVFPAGSAGRSR